MSNSIALPTSAPLKKRLYGQLTTTRTALTSIGSKHDETAAAAALASLSGAGGVGGGGASTTGPEPDSTKVCHDKVASAANATATATSTADSPIKRSLNAYPRLVHAPPKNKMMVDHTYSDFSVFDEDTLALLEKNSVVGDFVAKDSTMSPEEKEERVKSIAQLKKIFGDAPTRKNSGGVVQPFPEKLMEVLDRGDMEDIVRWMPHGRAFMVLQPQSFVKEVLPRFFKQSKFMSFTRQLNLWGFKRITKGTDSGAYYHELFLRGRPRLCMKMRRQKIKGTGIKLTPNPETEPDFYKLSKDSPLPPVNGKKVKPLPPLPTANNLPVGFSSPPMMQREQPSIAKASHLPVDAILGNRVTDTTIPSAHLTNTIQDRQGYPFTHLSLEQRGLAAAAARNHHMQQECDQMVPPPPPLPTRLSNPNRGFIGQADTISPSLSRNLNSTATHSRLANYPTEQPSRGAVYPSFAENRVPSIPTATNADLALLRERAAVAEQERAAVLRAKELLVQLNNRGVRDIPGQAGSSVDELKHQLLAAAENLGRTSANDTVHRPPVASRFGQEQTPTPASFYENSTFNSQPPLPTPPPPVPVCYQRNISALMSALEHTQQVAAAAQQQSVMLHQFARDLASNAPPQQIPQQQQQQQQQQHTPGSHYHNARHPY